MDKALPWEIKRTIEPVSCAIVAYVGTWTLTPGIWGEIVLW